MSYTYVRNCWYVACWTADLKHDKPLAVSILGEPVVIYRTASGQVAALADRCVHRLAPLSLGRCEGERLRCMYHGLLYQADGCVVEIPGQERIPPHARVRSYAVVERHSWVWVWMGEASQADAALIPQAVGLDDPQWVLGCGQLDYAAEARLICDNLCDFSHLSYVHANSFGASESWARTRPQVIGLERGVRFQRWLPGEQRMRSRGEGLGDVWSSYDFVLPGILLMSSGSFPVGTAAACNGEPPSPELKAQATGVTFTSQAVTPLTDRTARYFFSWGPRRGQGDEALRDTLMKLAFQAFGEDKLIIEAQQRVIDATPDPQILPTSADRGVTMFNNIVRKLARAEQAQQVEQPSTAPVSVQA